MIEHDPVELLAALAKALQSDSLDDFVKANPVVLSSSFLKLLGKLETEFVKAGDAEAYEQLRSIVGALEKFEGFGKQSAMASEFDALTPDLKRVLAKDLVEAEGKNDSAGIIRLCRSLIQRIDEARFPSLAAMVHLKLATTSLSQSKNDDSVTLEDPIRSLKKVVELLPPAEHPDELALAHYNLAAAYARPSWDDPAGDVERVIEHAKKALVIVAAGNATSVREFGIHSLLAEAYVNRELGNKEDNLDAAIDQLEMMLDSSPADEKKRLYNNLAAVYASRTRGGKARNDRKVAQYLKLASEA